MDYTVCSFTLDFHLDSASGSIGKRSEQKKRVDLGYFFFWLLSYCITMVWLCLSTEGLSNWMAISPHLTLLGF